MEEPRFVLARGTRIRTHPHLGSTGGMLIAEKHLRARRPNALATIGGWVPGHGGDVYWAYHDQDPIAACYCFTEFELEVDMPQLSEVVD